MQNTFASPSTRLKASTLIRPPRPIELSGIFPIVFARTPLTHINVLVGISEPSSNITL